MAQELILEVLEEGRESMQKAVEALKRDLGRVRTGRASLTLLDGVKVDYYGVPTPLNQVASLSVPESRMIVIQPWDNNMLGEIDKAINKSDLGVNPTNDNRNLYSQIMDITNFLGKGTDGRFINTIFPFPHQGFTTKLQQNPLIRKCSFCHEHQFLFLRQAEKFFYDETIKNTLKKAGQKSLYFS